MTNALDYPASEAAGNFAANDAPCRGTSVEFVTDLSPIAHGHEMPFGAQVLPEGGVRFRLWAPSYDRMKIVVDGRDAAPMIAQTGGWHEVLASDATAGSRYQFLLPDGTAVPDPASRFQPEDVQGPSEVVDSTQYAWRATAWRGRPWHESVVYEIHVGTFTEEGTFLAAMGRLDYLKDLGITAIEIMPVADFPGSRSWGYDGVLLYAPDSSYGRPEDFKAFIDAAHAREIQVFLDVVYNHFGPEGNYLPAYAPNFFTDRHQTPWGAALNFDGVHSRTVREFIIHNALYWLEEYQLDGLRLDAVHAIIDDSAQHVLKELAQRVRALRPSVHLILENEENRASLLVRNDQGVPCHYTGQWNDDVHHVLHTAATGEHRAYYSDYHGDTDMLGRALAEGFGFQGQMMKFRGTPRGEPSAMLVPGAFVTFIQNHDQVGNRAFGERISKLAPPAALKAIAAVYLLLPQIPMVFMGEEWGTEQPFPYFSNFGGDLAEKIREGRRKEFDQFPEFQEEAMRARIPDPEAEETFHLGKLRWSELSESTHAAWHDFYWRLLTTRREKIVPLLPAFKGHSAQYRVIAPGAVVVNWVHAHGELRLAINLSANETPGFPAIDGDVIWREGAPLGDERMAPWSVQWSLIETRQ